MRDQDQEGQAEQRQEYVREIGQCERFAAQCRASLAALAPGSSSAGILWQIAQEAGDDADEAREALARYDARR